MKMAAFTALNGGSPKASTDANGTSIDVNRAGSAELTQGPASSTEHKPRDQRSAEVSPTQREGGSWSSAAPALDRLNYASASHSELETSHKRKRSDDSTESSHRDAPAQMDRYHQEETRTERSQFSEPRERDPYERDQRDRDYRSYRDESRDRDRESWYSPRESRDERQAYSQPASAAPDSAQTDEQIGDALRRATEQSDYPATSPDGDDRSMHYSSQYSAERRDGVIQSDPKKRKRNFSNRTKTGCLTCRKRKKKCDEAKPECKYT